MNIALYGGSFDPPHRGHVHVALEALKRLDIDKLILVPAYKNPFKSSVCAEGKQRLHWLKHLFDPYPKIEISSFELDLGRSVYTIETVLHYAQIAKKLYVIIGADNLSSLPHWKESQRLQDIATLVVASRDGIAIPDTMLRLNVDEPVSSTHFRTTFTPLNLSHPIEQEIILYYKRKLMNPRIEKIHSVLDMNKAEDIQVFELTGSDYFADYVVLASSLGERHTVALLDHLRKGLKPEEQFLYVDESGDWVAIDLGDILIHILTPQYRLKYDLESFLADVSARKNKH